MTTNPLMRERINKIPAGGYDHAHARGFAHRRGCVASSLRGGSTPPAPSIIRLVGASRSYPSWGFASRGIHQGFIAGLYDEGRSDVPPLLPTGLSGASGP